MVAQSTGRMLFVGVSLALLLPGSLGVTPAPTVDAASARVESAWKASVGTGGRNGSATVRAYDTARGSVLLSLRGLTPSARYAVVIRKGACAFLGTQVTTLGTFSATRAGALSATVPLTVAQVAAVRGAAVGTSRLSLVAGTGTKARCGMLAKSPAVTPQVWFAPLPGWDYLPYVGSRDFKSLFDASAQWQAVAGRTHVFKFYASWVDQRHGGAATDAELRREIVALNARDIAIALELGPLTPEDGCGNSVEGFGGAPYVLQVIRRFAALGGTVRYIALDEPLHGAMIYDGPNACHWTLERTAREVAKSVRQIHAAYPSIIIGDIEPWPAVSSELLGRWLDAYQTAAGSPFPFFHLDVNWSIVPSDWVARVHAIERDARAHSARFGLIYNGSADGTPSTDAGWLAQAQRHILDFELDGGGVPDDAIFQSWTDKPDRTLPEAGPDTFTHLIADYTRTRTGMTVAGAPATSGGTIEVNGAVRTLGGDPVAGASVAVTATPRDGPYQVLEIRGTVPAGQTRALVGIRTNQEGVGPGSADLTFYEIGYAEGSETTNRVPNARFDHGLDYWGDGGGAMSVVPSDRGQGGMLRLIVSYGQPAGGNSGVFTVAPGATYRLWVAIRVPETSIGSTEVQAIFLGPPDDVPRGILRVAPAPIPLGSTSSSATGAFSLTTSPIQAGRYRLSAISTGDSEYWPARAAAEATVP